MKYQITICDNETGEIMLRTECSAIVGGITVEDSTFRIAVAQGSAFGAACAVAAAQGAAKSTLKELPKACRLLGKARKAVRTSPVCREDKEHG